MLLLKARTAAASLFPHSCSVRTVWTLYDRQCSVATHSSCGRIFSDSIITNFLLILIVKIFENRLIFGKVKAYKNGANFFRPPCIWRLAWVTSVKHTTVEMMRLLPAGMILFHHISRLLARRNIAVTRREIPAVWVKKVAP